MIKVTVKHDDPKNRKRIKVTTTHTHGGHYTDILKPGESREFEVHQFQSLSVQQHDISDGDDEDGKPSDS